jgi:hypothetical protein
VLDVLNVYMVETMDEVLKVALAEPLPPPIVAEGTAAAAAAPADEDEVADESRTH